MSSAAKKWQERWGGFVHPHPVMKTQDGGAYYDATPGMTLRDWFAGQAPEAPGWWMVEGCPSPPPGWSEGDGPTKWEELTVEWRVNSIALWRWAYADAMIAARKGGDA